MTALALFNIGLGPPQGLDGWVVRILGIIGAAALGGFGAGLLVQILAKILAAQKVPRPVLQIIRVLGAIALGWLVALILFSSGTGSGGLGGDGFGLGGKGKNGENDNDKDRDSSTNKKKSNGDAKPTKELQIEVVGEKRDPQMRFYRFLGEKRRWTLQEMDDYLAERRKEEPPVEKVVIVLYSEGSPAPDDPKVRQLEDAVKLRFPKVDRDIRKAEGKAPP